MFFLKGGQDKPQTDKVAQSPGKSREEKGTKEGRIESPNPKNEVKKDEKIKESISTPLDLDKLAIAVSVAETGGCKDGTALKRNNCFGIMQWDKQGRRSPKYYKTKEESFVDFKRIWSNPKGWYKGRFPDEFLASKWTGNDNPQSWLKNVKSVYYK